MSTGALYLVFAKFGLLCFGGGYMLVPLLMAELVGAPPKPLAPEVFRDLLSIAQVTPGPIGINTATYVGFTQQGIWGALCATAGMITPALILVILAILLLRKYEKSIVIQGFLAGMRPASFGLILSAAVVFSELSIFTAPLPWAEWLHGHFAGVGMRYGALLLAVITVILMRKTKIPFLWILAGSAMIGGFLCR